MKIKLEKKTSTSHVDIQELSTAGSALSKSAKTKNMG